MRQEGPGGCPDLPPPPRDAPPGNVMIWQNGNERRDSTVLALRRTTVSSGQHAPIEEDRRGEPVRLPARLHPHGRAPQVPRRLLRSLPQATPHRDALRAHVPAPPARHGRRGRDERLHRRTGQAPRRDQHRGRDLHPGHHRLAGPRGRAGARRPGPARRRRAVRRPRQGGAARPAVRLHARRDAGLGRSAPRLLRPRALPLLALRPGRLARRPALGRPARARHAHHGQGQERRARRGRHPRSRPPGSSARPRS